MFQYISIDESKINICGSVKVFVAQNITVLVTEKQVSALLQVCISSHREKEKKRSLWLSELMSWLYWEGCSLCSGRFCPLICGLSGTIQEKKHYKNDHGSCGNEMETKSALTKTLRSNYIIHTLCSNTSCQVMNDIISTLQIVSFHITHVRWLPPAVDDVTLSCQYDSITCYLPVKNKSRTGVLKERDKLEVKHLSCHFFGMI